MTTDTERDDFEAWEKTRPHYSEAFISGHAWLAWQSARAPLLADLKLAVDSIERAKALAEIFIWHIDNWSRLDYRGSEALKHGSPRQDAVMLEHDTRELLSRLSAYSGKTEKGDV